MTVLDVLATVRLRPVHVLFGAVIGIGCGKERPFSTRATQLEGSPSPTSQPGAAPSPSDASASVGDPEATNCSDVDCPLSAGGNDRSQSRSACSTNEDCPNASTPACDLATGLCVPCIADADCAPERPFCRQTSATSAGNVCVQCTVDAQCPESSPVCDLGSNECTSRCQDSAQCSGATPICDPAQRVCVQCQSSGDCSAPAPACDVATWRCVECLDDSTCAPGRFCNIQSHACVGCLDTSQCTDAFNAHCQTDANAPEPFTCAGCVEARDCSSKDGLGSHCRTNDGRCVECIADTDCAGSPSTTTCSPEGICGPCVTDADCAGLPGTSICVPGSGCVECVRNNDCIDNPDGAVCNTSGVGASGGAAPLNTCIECATNADCADPNASRCQSNRCVPCQDNLDCGSANSTAGTAGGTPLPVCDNGVCVQCTGLEREACGANVCDSRTKQCTTLPAGTAELCEPCVSDAQCALDARCVEQRLNQQALGFFCFPLSVGTPGACDPNLFIVPSTVSTIDEPSVEVCMLRQAACPAFRAHISGSGVCLDEGDDQSCGGGPEFGGACQLGPAGFRCTISCVSADDCRLAATCLNTGFCEL